MKVVAVFLCTDFLCMITPKLRVFYQVSFQQGVNGRGLYINWAMNAGMSYHT